MSILSGNMTPEAQDRTKTQTAAESQGGSYSGDWSGGELTSMDPVTLSFLSRTDDGYVLVSLEAGGYTPKYDYTTYGSSATGQTDVSTYDQNFVQFALGYQWGRPGFSVSGLMGYRSQTLVVDTSQSLYGRGSAPFSGNTYVSTNGQTAGLYFVISFEVGTLPWFFFGDITAGSFLGKSSTGIQSLSTGSGFSSLYIHQGSSSYDVSWTRFAFGGAYRTDGGITWKLGYSADTRSVSYPAYSSTGFIRTSSPTGTTTAVEPFSAAATRSAVNGESYDDVTTGIFLSVGFDLDFGESHGSDAGGVSKIKIVLPQNDGPNCSIHATACGGGKDGACACAAACNCAQKGDAACAAENRALAGKQGYACTP